MHSNTIKYLVKEVVMEASDVVTLYLSSSDDTIPKYIAGQFITIFFPETEHKEGKSYSISSSPHEKYMSITVHDIGTFSHKLCNKKVGDTIFGSYPYGYFYSESTTNTMIMIAGGIGIAPLMSMIKNVRIRFPERKVKLYYSNKTVRGILFKEELDYLATSSQDCLTVSYYITGEEDVKGCNKGRIHIEDVIKNLESVNDKSLNSQEFFICGSIAFVRDFWRNLTSLGIREEMIYTEAFF